MIYLKKKPLIIILCCICNPNEHEIFVLKWSVIRVLQFYRLFFPQLWALVTGFSLIYIMTIKCLKLTMEEQETTYPLLLFKGYKALEIHTSIVLFCSWKCICNGHYFRCKQSASSLFFSISFVSFLPEIHPRHAYLSVGDSFQPTRMEMR